MPEASWNLQIIEVPFSVNRRGVRRDYILCEASEPAVMAYRAEQFKGVVTTEDADGETRVRADVSKSHHIHESRLLLLGESIYDVTDCVKDGQLVPIGADALRTPDWPHRLIEKLFAKAEEISLLKREGLPTEDELEARIEELQEQLATVRAEKDAEKNSPGAGTGTSA